MSASGYTECPDPAGMDRAVSLGMDARGLFTTGIGRYIREVLAGVLADPRFGVVTLLGDPAELRGMVAGQAPGRVRVLDYPASWFSRRTQTAWLSLWSRGQTRADVWFFPVGDVPLLAHPRRSVATVHDLIAFKLPHLSEPKFRLATHVMVRGAAWRADRLIAISETTRRDVVQAIPSAAGKAVVVYQGVGGNFTPLGPGERLPDALARLRPYLLCVGNRSAHKNHVRAVEALAAARASLPELRLVVAGGRRNPAWDKVVSRARELGVGDVLVDIPAVDEEGLRLLYAGAEALVFPSLYEGFGLPVLEAMACGTPVVASNRSAVPEVAGDAALLVDPDDAGAIAGAVLRLAGDPELRASMVRRGLERAARFPWAATASRTTDILYSAAMPAKGPGRG